MIKLMLIAGTGGFLGTCGRYLMGRWCSSIFHGAFPLGTFMVNMIGCFLIGLFFGFLERHNLLSSAQNTLLITGFCGGFTTFSTFANDMVTLTDHGDWTTFILYTAGSMVLGILLVVAGRAVA